MIFLKFLKQNMIFINYIGKVALADSNFFIVKKKREFECMRSCLFLRELWSKFKT